MAVCKQSAGGIVAKPRGTDADGGTLIKLVGLPGLDNFLHFVKTRVAGGENLQRRVLVDRWRQANDHYHELETSEGGRADSIECLPLPAELRAHKRRAMAHRHFRLSFNDLPATIKWVELSKLLASQHSVAPDFSGRVSTRLGKRPTPAALFDLCVPLDPEPPPVRIQRLSESRYVFTSDSTDLRAHEIRLIPERIARRVESYGPVESGLLLPLGFGSNYLSGVRSENRIVLQNGYHRAFALMSLGITHAPMVIQTVTRTDELDLVASSEVSENASFYFRAARPPILNDFLDPLIAHHFALRRLETRIEIEVTVRTTTGPAARPM